MQFVKLNSGHSIPILGLGTWQATDAEIEKSVANALETGYRHIDTAFNYNNEEAIGAALKRWFDEGKGVREDLFITTKLPHVGNRAADVEKFLSLSLDRLKLTYIDLYLIHIPFGFVCDEKTLNPLVNDKGEYQLDLNTNHDSTWKALEGEVKKGRIRSLGVSNFNCSQLEKLFKHASEVKPSVLQIELHAYLQQKELRELCKCLGVTVTAYSPLGSPGAKAHFVTKYKYNPEHFPDILSQPVVKCLAVKYQKTPAQILLRHLIQQDIVVIPKSSNPTRIAENFGVLTFQLDDSEILELNNLDQGEKGRIFNFLFWKGVEKHPQYPFEISMDSNV